MIWLLLIPVVLLGALFAVYVEASGMMRSEDPPAPATRVAADPEWLERVEALIQREFHQRPKSMLAEGKTRLELLADKRRFFDELGTSRAFDAEFQPASIPVPGHTIAGEWTLVNGHDPDRRLLYLHGGGFTVGSSTSHRPITVALAKATGAAVFAPDYRLMPENARMDGIMDARMAFQWLVDHAPDGQREARELFVAGDSAGGSLTLMVAQWARENCSRQPDALVVFSPSTDYTLSAPSLKANFATDTMLQPLFRPFMKLSRPLLTLGVWKTSGMRPSDHRNSPLFGVLKRMPPTLIQVSAMEMLLDDARNYAAKAIAQGSEVELQVWEAGGDVPLPHVWQIFDRELPAAREAVERAGAWLVSRVAGKA